MTELSARARALVERARKEAAPSANDLLHLRARVTASLAHQAPDPVLLPFSLGKLGGLLMVAAVAAGAWYLRGAFEKHDRPAPVVLAPVPSVPEPVSCPPVPTCAPPEKPQPARVVACAPTPAADDEAQGGRSRRRMHEDLFSVAAAQRDPSLELQLLILARVALDEERSMDALGHMLRHEALYPKSAFAEERLAIQVLGYCAAGNREQAARRFEQLVELSPETTYLPRVRGTCGEDFAKETAP